MKKLMALVALFFAFASTSAIAKNDYTCDKKFIFFPGGPEGGPFGTIVYNGAVAAAEHTGCDVDYYWSQWNSEIMIKQFKEAVALQPDGIAIYGFPGDEAMRPIINEAREMGIIITTMNYILSCSLILLLCFSYVSSVTLTTILFLTLFPVSFLLKNIN